MYPVQRIQRRHPRATDDTKTGTIAAQLAASPTTRAYAAFVSGPQLVRQDPPCWEQVQAVAGYLSAYSDGFPAG
jgi:hypothetical protein